MGGKWHIRCPSSPAIIRSVPNHHTMGGGQRWHCWAVQRGDWVSRLQAERTWSPGRWGHRASQHVGLLLWHVVSCDPLASRFASLVWVKGFPQVCANTTYAMDASHHIDIWTKLFRTVPWVEATSSDTVLTSGSFPSGSFFNGPRAGRWLLQKLPAVGQKVTGNLAGGLAKPVVLLRARGCGTEEDLLLSGQTPVASACAGASWALWTVWKCGRRI